MILEMMKKASKPSYQNLIQFCVSCKRYCHKSCMNHVRTCSNRLGNRFTYTYDSTKQKVLWCSFDVGENEEFLLMSWDVLLRSNRSAKGKGIACCFEVGERTGSLDITMYAPLFQKNRSAKQRHWDAYLMWGKRRLSLDKLICATLFYAHMNLWLV